MLAKLSNQSMDQAKFVETDSEWEKCRVGSDQSWEDMKYCYEDI